LPFFPANHTSLITSSAINVLYCALAYLKNASPNFRQIFPHMSPPVVDRSSFEKTVIRHLLTVSGDIMFLYNKANRPKSKMTLSIVEFATWRQRGRSCCLRIPCLSVKKLNLIQQNMNPGSFTAEKGMGTQGSTELPYPSIHPALSLTVLTYATLKTKHSRTGTTIGRIVTNGL